MKVIANLLVGIVETWILFYLYSYFFKHVKVNKKWLVFVYSLDGFFCIVYSLLAQNSLQRMGCSILFIIIPLFLYVGKIPYKIILGVVYFAILTLSELLIKSILLGYRGDFSMYYNSYEYNYLIGVIFSKILAFIFIYLFTFIFYTRERKLPAYLYGFLFLIPISSVIIFYYLQNIIITVNTRSAYFGYAFITFALLLFNLIFFFLFSKASEISWLKAKLEYEKGIVQKQQQYHNNLIIYHQEVRQLYHDINNHFLILYNALTKNDFETAMKYIEKQLQILTKNKMVYSNYMLLDTIFFYKKQIANQQQTKCTIYY